MIQLFTTHKRNIVCCLILMSAFIFLSTGKLAAQGYLRNSNTTTFTSGVTITEVAGFGNPGADWNADGSVSTTTDEFVEITNTANDSIDISGWIIGDNGNNYTFPNGTILGPCKKAVIFQRSTTYGSSTPSPLQAGPSGFNPGDSNYAFVWGTGIANGGDAVGLKNKVGIYIGVRFNSSINTTLTGSSTLAGNQPNNTTTSSSTYRRQFYNADTWNTHPAISGKTFNWSTSSTTITNPAGSPGRDSSGLQLTPATPASTQSITFGSITANTIPISSLNNSLWNNRRMVVVREASNVSFVPTDTVAYSGVNSNFATASDQGSGNKIVYDGFATSGGVVSVSGLTPSTKYYFTVFEYNGRTPTSDIDYRSSIFANDSATTSTSSNPTVTLSVSANSGSEANATTITVTATASAAVSGNQTVDVGVSGTNITTGDYNLSNSTLTILNGNTTGSVTFTIVDDAVGETTETATLTISNPSSGLTLGSPVSQNISITDNEPQVSLSVASTSATEGDVVTLYAVLNNTATTTQTVSSGVSGSGVNAPDFSLSSNTFTFAPGDDTATITLTLVDDNIREATETFALNLSSPSSGISILTGSVNLAVADNDDAISINSLNTYLPADTFDAVITSAGSQMYRGWYLYEHGSGANGLYDTSSGYNGSGNTYSFGAFGSTERALGSVCAAAVDTVIYGAKYLNNTSGAINTLNISYVGEMWRYQGSADRLEFQYSLNANSVSDYNATWFDANVLDFTTPTGAASSALNGNNPANRTIFNNISLSVPSIASGATFYIRFIDVNSAGSDAGIAIDSFVMEAENIVTVNYYSKATGNLDSVANWGQNTDGSGQNPSNFTSPAQVFIIQNTSIATISNNWVVSGAGSKVVIGDSINTVKFFIPSSKSFTGNIDIKYKGILKTQNATLPNITAIESGSTIEFNHSSSYTIPNTLNYANLVLSGTGVKTFSGNTTTVTGDLLYDNVYVDYPGSTPFSTINLSGSVKFSGTVSNVDSTRSTSINTVGNGNQIIGSNNNRFHIFNIVSNKTSGSVRLMANSPLVVRGDLRLSMNGTATFNDSGNVITINDDLQLDGGDTAYTMTGTVIMRATTGTAQIEQNVTGGVVKPKLNHLVWNLTGSAVGGFSGSNGNITINGNMSIASTNSGNISLGSHTYNIKGNYIDSRTTDVVLEGTSKVNFNGSSFQTISIANPSGDKFYDLTFDNANHFSCNTVIISDTLHLISGVVNLHSDVIVEPGAVVDRVAGWVNGSVQKWVTVSASQSLSFEIGDSLNFLPVDVTLNNVTTAGYVEMQSNQTGIPGSAYYRVCIDTNKTVDRSWQLTAIGSTDADSYDAIIRFNGDDTIAGGASTPNIVAFADNGVDIEAAVITARTTSSLTITGDTLMGDIFVGEPMTITSTFSKTTSTPCIGTDVILTYTGSANASLSYNWTFGGGTLLSGVPSISQTVEWTSNGDKPLSLTVTGLGCSPSVTYDTITVFDNGWVGSVDTLWSRGANWCGGTVPTVTSSIVIPNGAANYPTVVNTGNCRNINIASGASVRIVTGGNLIVKGLFQKSGSLQHIGGYLTLDSSNDIPAGNYFALRLSSATGSTYRLMGNINVASVFQLSGSTSNILNTNGFDANLYNDAIINAQVTGTGNMNFLKTSGYQTLSSTSATQIANLVMNNASTGGIRVANDLKVNKLTLTAGSMVVNPSVTLTIGSNGCTTCNLITTGGSLLGGSSAGNSNIVIEGGTGSAQITNFKLSTPGNLTINRGSGVLLGSNLLVGANTTLSSGTLNMNGFNYTVGASSSSLGDITCSGGNIFNNKTTGTLFILGNSGSTLIDSVALDTMRNISLKRNGGFSLRNNFVLSGNASIQAGNLNLNGFNMQMMPAASLSETKCATINGQGTIIYNQTFSSALSNVNVGSLGLKLSTLGAPGATSIVRGHTISTHNSSSSTKRYYSVAVANPTTTNFLEFNYDSCELNNQTAAQLAVRSTSNGGTSWTSYISNPTLYKVSTLNSVSLLATAVKIITSDASNLFLAPIVNGGVVSSSTVNEKGNSLSVYPNPFNQDLILAIDMPAGQYEVVWFDMNGRRINASTIETSGDKSMINMSATNLADGVYYIQVKGNANSNIIKVVKQ